MATTASVPFAAQAQESGAISAATPQTALLNQTHAFDIPAGPLDVALTRYSEQSGIQLVYEPQNAAGVSSPAIQGTYNASEALRTLISGAGLVWLPVNDNTVALRRGEGAQVGPTQAGETLVAEAEAPGASDPSSVQIARRDGIEEIIVTGQKREERIQDVPIAISAFSMENLDNQKIEGGFDLLKAVPNVTFSKTNFTGYNFQIRGIGTQAISATTDPGVAVSFNNTTLIVNRLFEQEYLDIERVEVLRGPQGTLYGRNATAGVINVITAKPEMGITSGEWKIETGNYNSERFRGHVNWPFSDTVAARAAFALTKRDGYGRNLAFNDPDIRDFTTRYDREPIAENIDNRDLWTGRLSLGWEPTDRFRANLIYERFEEDDRRMRSTKQLCHHHDGNVMLYDLNGENPTTVRQAVDLAAQQYGRPPQSELRLRKNYTSQLSQGCLPGSLFDQGNLLSSNPQDHGAYGTPNGNSMPFVRALRSQAALVGPNGNAGGLAALPPAYPDCTTPAGTVGSDCVLDIMELPYGQSRDMRDVFSLINPRYEAMSELAELSFDYALSDVLNLSFQTVWTENQLFSTQDFLRFKTKPTFNDSSQVVMNCLAQGPWNGSSGCPNFAAAYGFRPRRMASPGGVVHHPQLGSSDRFLMQDVSQATTSQFSQELRLSSSSPGPVNFSAGVNYTHFENVSDYFVFINSLRALALAASGVYTPVLTRVPVPGAPGQTEVIAAGPDVIISCGLYYVDVWRDEEIGRDVASCIHLQDGSIDEVARDPQGHDFFLSRNPFELRSAGLFGEVYFNVNDQLKLTGGLRFNWDRKVFTPVPSQTMLSDWRGRVEGPYLAGSQRLTPLPPDADMYSVCHPRSPTRWDFGLLNQAPCALGGLSGKGYPALPDIVQEWRVPTGRLGFDWKTDLGADWVDEALVYGFYTRGYKAGGANPPVQASPSGMLLEAAQGVAAPRVFEAEYVNALELGVKSRLFQGLATLNLSSFYYDYKNYQVSKIVDRSAVNENFDATIWGLEMEALLALGPDTLFNASVGYLRTRIADGEQSLDLMDRTQGGNHVFRTGLANPAYDPNWAPGPGEDYGLNTPDQQFLAFDQWVVVRPTITQASSCVAPAALVRETIYGIARAGSGTMSEDGLSIYCPAGALTVQPPLPTGFSDYRPFRDAPNASAGILADIGGHELPNAPRFTVSLGLQHTYWISNDWSATGRVDWYWQDKSYHRVYNTEYDRLRDWSNTNLALWLSNDRHGLTLEIYAKNVFDETPVTGAFLNSDDTGLSTNVFTLDPRLVGISLRKTF